MLLLLLLLVVVVLLSVTCSFLESDERLACLHVEVLLGPWRVGTSSPSHLYAKAVRDEDGRNG